MTTYSLIEYKLRRYFYLGHEYSMYVPPPLRASSSNQYHQAYVTGVRIIGKIVKKNKPEEINNIVPIILKIKKEDKLHDDQYLIFALAVCAGFKLKQCAKMVDDAFAAILAICTDGLKLLMFVKSYETAKDLLCVEGYLSEEQSNFPKQFCRALSKWYLNKDPFLITEQVVRHKSYGGWTHKKVMKLIHVHSNEPSYKMINLYVNCGFNKVEEQFGTLLKNVRMRDEDETFENKQLKFMYNYLKEVHNLKKMDEITLRNAIEMNCWGKQFEIIPCNMLSSSKVLIALIKSMPMKNILEHTSIFAKRRVFEIMSPDNGLWEYILSFTNQNHLQQSRIHPIESFIEYVKYSRRSLNILKLQNIDSKKQTCLKIDPPDDKLKVFFDIKYLPSDDPNSVGAKKTSNASVKNKNTVQPAVKDLNEDVHLPSDDSNSVGAKKTSNASIKNKNTIQPAVKDLNEDVHLPSDDSNSVDAKKTLNASVENKNIVQPAVKDLNEDVHLPSDDSNSVGAKKISNASVENKNTVQPAVKNFNENIQANTSNPKKNINLSSINKNLISTSSANNKNNLLKQNLDINDVSQIKSKSDIIFYKPLPKLEEEILQFLSEGLVKNTLEFLKPSGHQIIITYDSRLYLKTKKCARTPLLNVNEAITLIVLSLTYPEKLSDKPTIRCLDEPGEEDNGNNEVIIDFNQPMSFKSLDSVLFKTSSTNAEDKKKIKNVNPLSTMNWAITNNKKYDLFVFLGSNKMNLQDIKKAKKKYQEFSKKPVKIIVCCLNGMHVDKFSLCRQNMLFIAGFDKYVGKIINSFINNEF